MRLAVWPGVLGLLAVAQAACFNPRAPRGAPCSTVEKACPDGQVCVAGFCGGREVDAAVADGATPGDAFLDSDGDGVADGVDNCRDMPNRDQRDEDGDKLGDACDLCPIDADNTDPDGDGVPGLCDPHPTTPGDKIATFESFHGALPANWQVVGTGTVAAAGDDAVITNTANKTTMLVSPLTDFGNGMIMASVTIDQTPGANRTALSLGLPYNPSTGKGIECQLHAPDPGSMNGREVSLFDSLGVSERNHNDFLWATAAPYRLAMIRTGGNYACSATDAGGAAKPANGSSGNTPMQSLVAVIASGTSARVAWVLVVTSP